MTMDDGDRVQCCHCLTQECYIHKLSFTPAVLTITHRKEQFVQDESTKRFTQRWSLQRSIIIQLNTRTNTLAEPYKTTHQSIRCIPAGSAWSVASVSTAWNRVPTVKMKSLDFLRTSDTKKSEPLSVLFWARNDNSDIKTWRCKANMPYILQ